MSHEQSATPDSTPQTAIPASSQQTSAETPWPLSHFSAKLRAHIDRVAPTWVEGQLVEFNLRNGTAWMTLRDLEQEVSFTAVAWRHVAGTLSGTVSPGSRVVAQVKPNLYEKSGRLSLVTQQMRPVGIGDLLARVEQLRRTLSAEGLFDPSRKRPLPVLPARIGLITGRNSDAMKDVLRNVHSRWGAAEFEIREVATQGSNAPMEVAAALAQLDESPSVEVIVIARGGGALEEVVLPFSDERLIRAVAGSNTPVVSAIGHEADRPLLDEVADMRASTPTAAAKLLVPDEHQEREGITQARARMSAGVERMIDRESQWLEAIRSRPVLSQPETMLTQLSEETAALRRRALIAVETTTARARDWVHQTRARVRALSPQSTLDRGYAVVQSGAAEGRIIRSADQLHSGDAVQVMLASGEFHAQVTSTTAGEAETEPHQRTPGAE